MMSILQVDDRILSVAESLPAAPRIMSRLHRLLLDSKSGLVEIAQLLKCDPALVMRLVRIANSPRYQGNGIGSVEGALQRVGFGEVFLLVGVAVNAALAEGELRCYGYSAEEFRTHNLAVALIAERVAQETGQDARLAYTAGLLRCVGRLVLDISARHEMSAEQTWPRAAGMSLAQWEQQAFGVTSREVAGLLLQRWDFSADVVEAVRAETGAVVPTGSLGEILGVADWMVRAIGFGLNEEPDAHGDAEASLAAFGWSHDQARAIGLEAAQRVLTLLAI